MSPVFSFSFRPWFLLRPESVLDCASIFACDRYQIVSCRI